MPDLHNHTYYCHHASGTPAEYIERARSIGLNEYGFAEHSPWMFQYEDDQIAPTPEEFQEYLKVMEELRTNEKKTGGVNLRIGIELDYIPEKQDEAKNVVSAYPFDFHIGSVHNLGDWIFDHPDHLDDWKEKDIKAVYNDYFFCLKELLLWGTVDILGHLDLPKKFGHVPPDGYMDLVAELLPLIVDTEVVVEINTAGKDKPVGEFYPSTDIVKLLAKAGVPFTVGSDAHAVDQVGRHRAEAIRLLRDNGVREIISFNQRRKIGVRI